MSSSEETEASLTSLDQLHLFLTNSELKWQWKQPLPVAVLGIIIIVTAQLLLATSFTASRNSRTRFMKAPRLITSTSELMISAFTALRRAQNFTYGLACHTGGGSWERPLTESETETGSGFESLYRVAGSDTWMLRKKKFHEAVQELFTFQNYLWNNRSFWCTNRCIAPKY